MPFFLGLALSLLLLSKSVETTTDAACSKPTSDSSKALSFLQTGASIPASRIVHEAVPKKRRSRVERKRASHGLSALQVFPWSDSVRKLHHLAPQSGVTETIWSSGRDRGEDHACGTPCVAHCIVGQPRDFMNAPGLRKALKHRVFDKFSADPVVFAVFVTSAYHHSQADSAMHDGSAGLARTEVGEIDDTLQTTLVAGMEEIGVERALLLNETCQDPSCMENPRLQCDAKDLQLTSGYDESDGKLHHICDVQFKRFQTCMNLVREYEQEHRMQFDWVTRSRPDVYWIKPIVPASDLELLGRQSYVTPWNAAYGAMDWFFIMPRQDADLFSQFSDEASCSQLHHPEILPSCATSLGCECWMASWLYQKNITFSRLQDSPYMVAKFCGDRCPADWNVTATSIEDR